MVASVVTINIKFFKCINRLIYSSCRSNNILDYHYPVSVTQGTTEKYSLVSVILYFLTVRSVSDLTAVKLTKCNDRCCRERNTLVGRTEEYIKVIAEGVMYCLCIILPKPF